MKTSKIIIISFFSFVGLFLLSFMILGFAFNSIAIKEIREKRNNFEKRAKIFMIEKPFKHIFVKNEGSIIILEGEKLLIKSNSYNSKDSLIVPTYEILNDTLFISLRKEINTTLELNNLENLITISGTNTSVNLFSLNISSLKLNFTSGNISIDKGVNISKLDVNLYDNSEFSATQILNVDTNNSNVRLPKALHIDLDIDKISKVSM